MSKFCAHCGKPLPDNGKFCPSCGKPCPAAPPIANPIESDPIPKLNTEPLWKIPIAATAPAPTSTPAPSASAAPHAPAPSFTYTAPQPPATKPPKSSGAYWALGIIAAVILLIGTIVAFAAGELVSTNITDGGEIASAGIGLHVFVVMLFVLAGDGLYLIANLKFAPTKPSTAHWAFHGAIALSGLFLSLATAFAHRAAIFDRFYDSMLSAPDWYSGGITGNTWFFQLDDIADRYSGYASIFYVLMIISFGAIVACRIWMYQQDKKRGQATAPANGNYRI